MCVQSSEGWAKRVDAHTHTHTHTHNSFTRTRARAHTYPHTSADGQPHAQARQPENQCSNSVTYSSLILMQSIKKKERSGHRSKAKEAQETGKHIRCKIAHAARLTQGQARQMAWGS